MNPELGTTWRKFRLRPGEEKTFDSDGSSSHYELGALLEKSFKGQNGLKIAKSPKLKGQYFKLLDRIYMSESSYYLNPALTIPLDSPIPEVREFGTDAFYHVMETMGFTPHETAILVHLWSEGMSEKDRNNGSNVIAKGIEHHMIPIVEVERYRRGGFHTLFKEFGIANAKRYYGRTLKLQYEFKDHLNLPYIQHIMAAHDYNGAVLGPSTLARLSDDIGNLKWREKTIDVAARAVEVENHNDLAIRKRQLLKRYGPGKVTAYHLFGHSDGRTIDLGGENCTSGKLTIQDIINLDVFGKKSGEHVEHPTIILNSCSTGRTLAQPISAYFNARVYAPVVPSSIYHIFVDGRTSQIEKVVYNDPGVIFDRGDFVGFIEPRYP